MIEKMITMKKQTKEHIDNRMKGRIEAAKKRGYYWSESWKQKHTVQKEARICKCGCGETFECRPKQVRKFKNKDHFDVYQKRVNFNLGRKRSKESIEKQFKTRNENADKRGYYWSDETNKIRGLSISKAKEGKTLEEMGHKPDCICFCCKAKRGEYQGENNSAWLGGISNLPYSIEFNDKLKESVRKRDNYTCQCCGMTEEEHLIVYNTNLHTHHIDHDKLNNQETNLIALCLACNNRANYNLEYWKEYFTNKILVKINL
jgi:hypothetical protein